MLVSECLPCADRTMRRVEDADRVGEEVRRKEAAFAAKRRLPSAAAARDDAALARNSRRRGAVAVRASGRRRFGVRWLAAESALFLVRVRGMETGIDRDWRTGLRRRAKVVPEVASRSARAGPTTPGVGEASGPIATLEELGRLPVKDGRRWGA